MKTVEEVFDEIAKDYGWARFESAIALGSNKIDEISKHAAMRYALQVAEAVRDECARIAENANTKRPPFDIDAFKLIDLTTFIK